LQFFPKEEDIYAVDEEPLAQVGDLVLVHKLDVEPQKNVTHRVSSVVQRCGDWVDAVTGKPVWQEQYRDEMERRDRLYGKREGAYEYARAQPRGWQRGRRDFSDNVTYHKWHDDPRHEDKYNNVS